MRASVFDPWKTGSWLRDGWLCWCPSTDGSQKRGDTPEKAGFGPSTTAWCLGETGRFLGKTDVWGERID